jgi:CBS domain-containing protein
MIGGCVGALFGGLLPDYGAGNWALLGMSATMAGALRAPLTSMMFGMEVTGDAKLALPLLTACGASYAVTVLVMKRSILTEKLARRGRHISQEYSVDPLDLALVRDVMAVPVETVPADMRLSRLAGFFAEARHKTYPVVDGEGRPVALVSRSDALAAVERGPEEGDATLAEAFAERAFPTAQPDDPVSQLVAMMVRTDIGRIVVVRPSDGKLVGIVARSDLLRVRSRMFVEETERQSYMGWRRRAAA